MIWAAMGDFNAITCQEEKQRGLPANRTQMDIFNDFINDTGFIQMNIEGADFSWSNNRTGDENIRQRIDKILVTTDWNDCFANAHGFYEAVIG